MSDYHCMKCGSDKVIWGGNYMFEDYGIEGNGIVSCYQCQNCNARIIYEERMETKDDKNQKR